jgi:hypothetical protein
MKKSVSCFIVGALCNGSTTDFDSVSLGSIPNAPAKFYAWLVKWYNVTLPTLRQGFDSLTPHQFNV